MPHNERPDQRLLLAHLDEHDDRQVPKPPTKWQKKVLIEALRLRGKQRTRVQKQVIRATKAWRKKTGWKPPKPKPKPLPKGDLRRRAIVKWSLWTANHAGSLSYSQSRPKWRIKNNWTAYNVANLNDEPLDCSSHAIKAHQVAGAPSPSVYGYSGYGSTHDMEYRGRYVDGDDVLPADLKYYNGHVVTVVGTMGSLLDDPEYRGFAVVQRAGRRYSRNTLMCVSHGSSAGPYLINVYYRGDYHSGFRRYF